MWTKARWPTKKTDRHIHTDRGNDTKAQRHRETDRCSVCVCSGGSKNFEKGGRQFISPRPHLSQMHTTMYRPFTPKKAAFWKEILSQYGAPLESATVCVSYLVSVVVSWVVEVVTESWHHEREQIEAIELCGQISHHYQTVCLHDSTSYAHHILVT